MKAKTKAETKTETVIEQFTSVLTQGKTGIILNCTLSLLRLQPAAHKHCSWSPHKLRSVYKRKKASSKINALQTQLCFKVRLIKN